MEDETHQPRRRGRPPLPPLAGREGKRNRVPERTALLSAIAEQLLAAGESMSDFCRDRLGIPESRFRAAANGRKHLSPRMTGALAKAIASLSLDTDAAGVFLDPASKRQPSTTSHPHHSAPNTSARIRRDILSKRARLVELLEERLFDADIRLSQFCPNVVGVTADHFRSVARGKRNGFGRRATIALGRAMNQLGLNGQIAICFLSPDEARQPRLRQGVESAILRRDEALVPAQSPQYRSLSEDFHGWVEIAGVRARIPLTPAKPYDYSVITHGMEITVSVVARDLWADKSGIRARAATGAAAAAKSASKDAAGLTNVAALESEH